MDKSRILLIRFSSIGDIVLTTPLLKSIKKKFPDSIIDYLTLKEFVPLLKDNPYIDNLISVERNNGFSYYFRKSIELRKNNYNYIFDLHRSTRSFIFRIFLKSAVKKKLSKNYIKRFFLTFFKLNLYKPPYTVIARYFKAVKIPGMEIDFTSEIWLNRSEFKQAADKLKNLTGEDLYIPNDIIDNKIRIGHINIQSNKRTISLMPFAKWNTKEWGDDKFAELGRLIIKNDNVRIQILGGSGDKDRAKKITAFIGPGSVSLAGDLTLAETAAALSASGCLVSNDTGVMHMGGAVNIPVIAIFGCTTEELGFFPVHKSAEIIQIPLKCRPCTAKGLSKCPEKHFRCMKDISIDMIYSAVKKYIRT